MQAAVRAAGELHPARAGRGGVAQALRVRAASSKAPVRIALTAGEPAGIGPELCAMLAAPAAQDLTNRLVRKGSMSGSTWAPVFVCYGNNNRTNTLRIPLAGGRVERLDLAAEALGGAGIDQAHAAQAGEQRGGERDAQGKTGESTVHDCRSIGCVGTGGRPGPTVALVYRDETQPAVL